MCSMNHYTVECRDSFNIFMRQTNQTPKLKITQLDNKPYMRAFTQIFLNGDQDKRKKELVHKQNEELHSASNRQQNIFSFNIYLK